MFINILCICAGGFFGATCRYFVSQYIGSKGESKIPTGTLTVNVCGSFLLGLLYGAEPNEHLLFLTGTGFMGAFTTFSTLQLEALNLLQSKERLHAWLYIGLTYSLGIGFAFMGYMLGY